MSLISSKAIVLEKFGDPNKVLQLKTLSINTDIGPNEVLVKWLAAPINPTDVNKIQGDYVYAIKTDLPFVPGSEATGVVEKVGTSVTKLKHGDSVVALVPHTALWNEYSVVEASKLMKIDSRLDLVSAATLVINPPTAYIMLKEFIDLKKGDVVIQDASNSGVGRSVIQLARAFGYKTINIIRSRLKVADLKNELKDLGADWVFTEEEFLVEKSSFLKTLDTPIRLALDGVGGKTSLAIASALSPNGAFVFYGGMAAKPQKYATFELPTFHLLLNRISVHSIIVYAFLQDPNWQDKSKKMFDEIQTLILNGKCKPTPVEIVELENFKEGIKNAVDRKGVKQLLLLHPDAKKKL